LESLFFYGVLGIIPFVTSLITKKIEQLEKWEGTIVLMSTFTSFGITTMTAIQDVMAEKLTFNDFYIIMGIFAAIQLGFGLLYRKNVKENFKKSYYTFLSSYTYIFFATAVSMHWWSRYFGLPA